MESVADEQPPPTATASTAGAMTTDAVAHDAVTGNPAGTTVDAVTENDADAGEHTGTATGPETVAPVTRPQPYRNRHQSTAGAEDVETSAVTAAVTTTLSYDSQLYSTTDVNMK